MSAKIIEGKKYSQKIRAEIKDTITTRIKTGQTVPGLATVLIGDNPASKSYVRAKHRASEEVGVHSFSHELPEDIQQKEVEELIDVLNKDKQVHGILVQLPMPKHLNEEAILGKIRLDKDVDGFHPVNIGRLAQKGRNPIFSPCTPSGIIYILKECMESLEGKRAVVLGRSNIVGMPVSLLLLKENATVTICHSRTRDIAEEVKRADILVAAIGKPEFVHGDWIKPGAVVIDVGVNRVDDAAAKRGYRLVGDVAFSEAVKIASAITPVPGGVGPMTIAMLLRNTLIAAERIDG